MAEIRKFDPEAGNAIAQALRAAMGDPVHPKAPGETSSMPDVAPVPAAPQTSTFHFTVTTIETSEADDSDEPN
jgi:hypothetical protein